MQGKRALFIDRDGTVIVEPPVTKQVDRLDLLEFVPGAIAALATIAREGIFELVMVTNQDGLGTPSFPEESFWPPHNEMLRVLATEGVQFSEILIDRSFAHEGKPTRKPGTAMLNRYMDGEYDLDGSFVIGDRITDIELACNLRCKSIYFSDEADSRAALSTVGWDRIAAFVLDDHRGGASRCGSVENCGCGEK
jgi:imidazoleglycerol-phosphate dehydratase/histidinol-phosphatase